MIVSNDSWDVDNTYVKKIRFSKIMIDSLDKNFYHRVYESSNNTETFWSFYNDILATSKENEK